MPVPSSRTSLLLVLPIYNEEEQLEGSVRKLRDYAERELDGDYDWRILVGDNASTDRSPEICRRLAAEDKRLTFKRLEQKGRGRMLKAVWLDEPYDISLYMDVDLSTDVAHIKPSLEAIRAQGYDLAIGSRLKKGARVANRTFLRELTSRAYVAILHLTSGSRLSDYQCGFKAIGRPAARRLLPLVEDAGWFFDSELLLIAEKSGLKIHEEAVRWNDDPGSTVKVWRTAMDDLRGLRRVLRAKPWTGLISSK